MILHKQQIQSLTMYTKKMCYSSLLLITMTLKREEGKKVDVLILINLVLLVNVLRLYFCLARTQ